MSKRYEMQVYGEQTTYYNRVLVVEVPEDATESELNQLAPATFEEVAVPSLWYEWDNTGIHADEEYEPIVLRKAGEGDRIDARLVRNCDGKLVLAKDS